MSISDDAIAKATAALFGGSDESAPAETAVEAEEAPEVEAAEEPEAEVEPVEAAAEEKPTEESDKPAEENEAFKKLAEREREFRKKELEFKKQASKLSQRMKELEARESKLKNPDTLLDVLDSMGMTMDQFQRGLLTGELKVEKPQLDPATQKQLEIERELQALKEFREQERQRQERAELEHHLNVWRGKVKESVSQFENLADWFGDELDEVVKEAEAAGEAYAQEYNEAPDINELLSVLDAKYGKQLSRLKSRIAPKVEEKPKKEASQPKSKTLTHNHTRSVTADTSKEDLVAKVAKSNPRDVMQERAMAIFKKHGQLL